MLLKNHEVDYIYENTTVSRYVNSYDFIVYSESHQKYDGKLIVFEPLSLKDGSVFLISQNINNQWRF
jgi:hypothetical protein